jgi:hypothetical protein
MKTALKELERRIYKTRRIRFNLLAAGTIKFHDPLIIVANLLRVRLLLQKNAEGRRSDATSVE